MEVHGKEMIKQGAQGDKLHFKELDVLRGLAAILMVVNHVGAALAPASLLAQPVAGALFFIGSFAPVLFFFVTGIGAGIQSNRPPARGRWLTIGIKVGILFMADLLMQWGRGRPIGLDFLGFIGLSVLILEVIKTLRFPAIACAVGIGLVSLMRYGVAPLLRSLHLELPWVLNWIFGNIVEFVSYPLSPWIAYPLLGFLIGRSLQRYGSLLSGRPTWILLGLTGAGIMPAIGSVLLAQRSETAFFRWGSVAIGFYIASFAVVAYGLLLAWALCCFYSLKPVQSFLALRGVASFAIVPIHYLLIDIMTYTGIRVMSVISYTIIGVLVIGIAFLLAYQVETLAKKAARIKAQETVWLSLASVVALFSILTWVGVPNSLLTSLSTTAGQVALCILFLVRSPFQPKLAPS